MQLHKKYLGAAVLAALLFCLFCPPAFAVSEGDLQAQVEATGKEAVSGTVLVWFLCAVAFLKVSQKIDSFMASLGIHVGRTGGSMMAEAMIAARGLGSVRSFSHAHSSSGQRKPYASPAAGASRTSAFLSGGLAGIVSRQITSSAMRTATEPPGNQAAGGSAGTNPAGKTGGRAFGIGGRLYASSVSKGGDFANGVIGSVATGSPSLAGSISGQRAAEALYSYMGYAALGPGAQHVPSFKNVEIGGGRITGTEVSEKHPEGIAFGMYHTAQYFAPDGAYTTIQAADGSSWYKQYAVDTVNKSPYTAPDGSVAHHESIVKKLPPAPKRKEKM